MRNDSFQPVPIPPTISIDDLESMSENANEVVRQARSMMLAPTSIKTAPTFNTADLAQLTGLDQSKILYLAKKGELPSGERPGTSRREWTIDEVRAWVRSQRPQRLRDPASAAGVVITVANFKGGATKTTTAAVLAQGLSLRGHRVLAIDCDPQGSLTTLFGKLPDLEVEEEDTILPLCQGETDTIMPSVKPTYWSGVDLVCASPLLFGAEFTLPARQRSDSNFAFWRVLDAGLDEARSIYDVIIIDTPPSLSYITINALIAAQGVVMPTQPNALDFISTSMFWRLVPEVCRGLLNARGDHKHFNFLDIFLAKVDRADAVSSAVRQWVVGAYGAKVLPIEIPKTSTAATASAEFGTVYDLDKSSVQAKTLKRARDAYDQLVDHIEIQVQGVWAADAEAVRRLNATSTETPQGEVA